MNRCLPSLALALATLAAPAVAQQRDDETIRQAFTFLGDRLTVWVEADAPGTLRMIRGQGGRLEVAGRARDGFAGFGLSDRVGDELHLTAVSAESVEFLVIVPASVRVTVRLPDRPVAEVFGAFDRMAALRWQRP